MADAAAEAEFKAVVDGTWRVLKPLGYFKQGNKFRRCYAPNLAIIQFQRSQYNGTESVRYTVNVSIVSAVLAREVGLINELARASEWHGHFRKRIGFFREPPLDTWWTAEAGGSSANSATEIAGLLQARVLPFLDSCHSDSDLLKLGRNVQHFNGSGEEHRKHVFNCVHVTP